MKIFYILLPLEWIESVTHILHLQQKINLGLFFFSPSNSNTVIYTCSICIRSGDQSCILQIGLLVIGVCCFVVLGHVESGESSCMKMKVWHLRKDCFSITTISLLRRENLDWTIELWSLHGVFQKGIWCDK